jgi:hypothetical protein
VKTPTGDSGIFLPGAAVCSRGLRERISAAAAAAAAPAELAAALAVVTMAEPTPGGVGRGDGGESGVWIGEGY